jgi:hypothetical protein
MGTPEIILVVLAVLIVVVALFIISKVISLFSAKKQR